MHEHRRNPGIASLPDPFSILVARLLASWTGPTGDQSRVGICPFLNCRLLTSESGSIPLSCMALPDLTPAAT